MEKNNLKNIIGKSQSNWREKAQFRRSNKWLKYSSKIARRILAAIEDNPTLTQARLAKTLNVSPQQISKIVKGKENLTLETIYNLSEALGVQLITFPTYKYSTIPLDYMNLNVRSMYYHTTPDFQKWESVLTKSGSGITIYIENPNFTNNVVIDASKMQQISQSSIPDILY